MKNLLIVLLLINAGAAYSQQNRSSIFPFLDPSNKWIYTSYFRHVYYNELDSNYTEIKEITGDTMIGGISYISVRNTTIKDSLLTIIPELWRVDSTSFYIFYGNQEYTLYDTTITHDTLLWGGQFSWAIVWVYNQVWWDEEREIQQWERGTSYPDTYERFKTARDLGILHIYDNYAWGDILYLSNIAGATINGMPYGKPAPPLDVIAIPDTHQVELTWRPNSETDILRYRIYSKILPDSIVLIDSTSNADTAKTVSGLNSGTQYYFYITAADTELNESNFSVRTAIQTPGPSTPIDEHHTNIFNTIELYQNYPNPFNPVTTIKYYLPKVSRVDLVVYDIGGREIRRLVNNEYQRPGMNTVIWDGKNNFHNPVSSGIYICRLHVEGKTIMSKKMILLR